jgi:hypothetical protein
MFKTNGARTTKRKEKQTTKNKKKKQTLSMVIDLYQLHHHCHYHQKDFRIKRRRR